MVTTAFDSLVIGETIEVWGPPGGVPSLNPMCAGAVFRIQPPFSLGAPQPTTDFVATLIVDGEKPFGDRSADRTITLNVLIKAPDYKTLAGARELLLKTIDAPHWPLTWTRASGADPGPLPLVLDCFRAQPSVLPLGGPEEYRVQNRSQYETQVTLTFEALPYGRSDTQQQIAFAAPIASINAPPAPPAPVVLDAFSTINSPQCTQSANVAAQHVVGPNSCYWDPRYDPYDADDGYNSPLVYSAALPAAVNLGGMTGLSLWLGLASRYYFNHHPHGQTRVVLSFSLTDSNNVTLAWSEKSELLPVSADPQAPVFTRITAHIPQNSATFNYGAVTAYSLTITNRAPRCDTPRGELRWTVAYLDALTAYPSSTVIAAPSPRGSVYKLHGVTGTHRAPVSLQFQAAPSAASPTTITATGPGVYTVPGGTIYLKVEATGGGGAGATQTVAGYGGGGGGGEYAAELTFPAAVAAQIQYSVGTGDTAGATASFGRSTTFGPAPGGTLAVSANGGTSAAQNSITGGAGGTGSGNSVHFPGGAGRTASGSVGGGGGSSGGNASAGNTPTGTAATVFTSPGTSTWTCPAGVTQVYAECWGSGGSGGTGSGWGNGAGGSGGEYAAAYVNVTPGNVYTYTVGAGAATVTGTGVTGNNGNSSVFTGNAGAAVTAHGGLAGRADQSGQSQNGPAGGSGSTNTVHFNGGAGGGNQPYSGSGGSSAGTAAVGNPGSRYGGAGGTAPSGGGNGGAGTGSGGGNGTVGSAPGGGGGGTYYSSTTSGAGAAGQVRLTYPGGAPTNNGGIAVAGGGAGGAGGPSANTTGSAGSQPGGGGGGADSSGTTEAGGAGGAGKLIITPFASAAFKTLIVHRPGTWSPMQLNPFVPVGAGLVAPGATEYSVPSLVTGINADFNGTYTVLLTNFSFNSPGSTRTISVTVRQYESPGGAHYDTTTTPVTITPSTQAVNGLLVAGTLTLPLKAVPSDNTAGYYTVLVSDTNGSDRWYDCLFLDVQGQTVIINEPTSGYINYYFDEPDPCHDLGNYLGSQLGRTAAISVTDAMTISGGPITIDPGTCTLLAYAQEGAPSIAVSYFPRYFSERLE